MNTALRESIQQADGRYLSDAELQPLAGYVQSFVVRFNTYSLLREHSQNLVLQTLRKLIQTHRKTVQDHGPKCQRDMGYTLECIARAVLLDDASGFVEEYVLWLQNITRSLHKEESAVEAYRLLKGEIVLAFPPESAQLVAPHLERLIAALATGL
ncbi:hypothetical protein [Pseudanabaena sp. FACHB-2040]|uniref:hypothetical protein n=1 Tax=Pseudanabaena sp. FACHB-2040 TaxID=2692859 RepID=UPI0016863FD0|nr:hypothetical protein [Pseudanabaena sp. FACHB-2040]MBD2257327.1 hypothetical protein [Pseudanabaena sp. FACHB-2040]